MQKIRRITPVVLLLGALVLPAAISINLHQAPAAVGQEALAPAAPAFSLQGGRFSAPQHLEIGAAAGAEIYFTLDGSEPTQRSTRYTGAITLSKPTNVAAIAVVNGVASKAAIEGYLVKTAEKPLASFAVMSDIHTSVYEEPDITRWQSHFNTLSRLLPKPDAIISNGDMINDNNFNTGDAHEVVKRIFQENLARTGMDATKVFMSYGNHDDTLVKMTSEYPKEWFPHEGGGYYQADIKGYPLLVLNTESYNAAQRAWVKERLTALTADPAMRNKPIFVAGHRPIAGTVMDGMQATNQAINTDLSEFPQVVAFTGHSHLNLNDERSIYQNNFTAVNDGSMTYGETPGQYWPNGDGLVWTAHNTTSQSLIVEVYADRTEIDRINYAAENERAYTPEGAWLFQQNPPFEAAGTLAGPTWTIRTAGATPAEIRAAFQYTPANRNKVPPVASAEAATVRQGADGPVLRIPQATDDQFVSGYRVSITDVATGQLWPGILPTTEISSDFYMAPRPAFVDVPLAVRQSQLPGRPIDRRVVIGREYEATITAVDSYGNTAVPQTFRFVAGELHHDAGLATAVAAEEGRVGRILGDPATAAPADFALALSDTARAKVLLTALAGERDALAAEGTQSGIESRERTMASQLAELSGLVTAVDRAALAKTIADAVLLQAHDPASGSAGNAAAHGTKRAKFREALGVAQAIAGTLNVQQTAIDAATRALADAIESYPGPGFLPHGWAQGQPS